MRILQLLTIVAVLGTSLPLGLAQDSLWFRTLYSFTGGNDGAYPFAGVTGQNGVIYGTTQFGGTGNVGTVFSLTPPASPGGAWTETVLHTFTGGSDGANAGRVVIDKSGVLYGTTYSGGTSNAGTVFSLTPPASPGGAWTETVLHTFTGYSDANPNAGLAIGKSGVLYGTTFSGGTTGSGTVFSLTPPPSPGGAWTETVLYNFTGGSDGGNPNAGPAIGKSGVLYGTTSSGGTTGNGTVFSLTPPVSPGGAWKETVLHGFTGGTGGSEAFSLGGVVIGLGVLYGVTLSGGTGTCTYIGILGCGTVFSLTPPVSPGGAWTETVLHGFTGDNGGGDGAFPSGVVIGKSGVLYGTTIGNTGYGTVFSLTPPASPAGAWTETVLYTFTGGSDGSSPNGGVAITKNGVLFGTAPFGGTGNIGTVFALKP